MTIPIAEAPPGTMTPEPEPPEPPDPFAVNSLYAMLAMLAREARLALGLHPEDRVHVDVAVFAEADASYDKMPWPVKKGEGSSWKCVEHPASPTDRTAVTVFKPRR